MACSRVTTIFSKRVVRLDLLFHLRLDLLEILRRDAVRQIDVVIKSVFDRRPGGELRLGPEPQDGGGQHVRGGMADAFQLGHLRAVVEGFAFRVRSRTAVLDFQQTWVKINNKETKKRRRKNVPAWFLGCLVVQNSTVLISKSSAIRQTRPAAARPRPSRRCACIAGKIPATPRRPPGR